MIHIAICDDEEVELDYLKSLVSAWGHDKGVSITTFTSGEAFMFAYPDMPKLDILLLDIQMGEDKIDGMALAKTLRKTNEHLHIIFITGYPDFMAEGYDVQALHYLMKPIKEAQFLAVLDKASQGIKAPELIVHTAQGITKVLHKDIIYIEAFAHYVQITTTQGVLETRANIGDMATALGEGFVRAHRSYVVGYRHIQQITKTDIVLDGGATLPLSRRLAKEVNQGFIKFYRGDMYA